MESDGRLQILVLYELPEGAPQALAAADEGTDREALLKGHLRVLGDMAIQNGGCIINIVLLLCH